jgi:uncharacterized membrane protein YhaH (DUF805 family)
MGFMEAVQLFFRRYVDFQGRSRRSEYWWVALFNVIIFAVLGGAAAALGVFSPGALESGDINPMAWIPLGILGLYGLAIIIPSISLFVRRLHDINQTGWIYLGLFLMGFIPVVGLIASIAQIVIACIPGTVGPNKYGADPKGGGVPSPTTFS